MAKLRPCILLAVALTACIAQRSFAQNPSTAPATPSTNSPITPSQLEAAQYKVSGVIVDDPFSFLPFINARRNALAKSLITLLVNQPYTLATAKTKAFELIQQSGLVPEGDYNFQFDVQALNIEDIDTQAHTLKLRYRILSIAPPYDLGGALESNLESQTSPQTVGGISQMRHTVSLLPEFAYNRASGFLGGGTFSLASTGRLSPFIRTASIAGQGSGNTRALDVALTGSTHSKSLFTDTSWSLNYTNHAAPVGTSSIAYAALSAQFATQTRPFWNASTFFRTGLLLAGGNEQAEVTAVPLPPNTIANTDAGSLRIYEGLSQFSHHNVLSISYGLELGSAQPISRIDWRKHIAEVSADSWFEIGDHHPFEIESNLNIGALQVPEEVPLAERFFAGNAEHFFIPSDTWQIHDQPYIRAIPANQLSTTVQGLGGDAFTALNLTFSYPLFVRSLVPKEATSDPQVKSAINFALVSAQSLDANYYEFKDPSFQAAAALLPTIQASLTKLQSDLTAAQAASPNSGLDFGDCSQAISDGLTAVHNAAADTSSLQFGRVTSLTNFTPSDDDRLGVVQQYCADNLNATLGNAAIRSDLGVIATQQAAILMNLQKINQKDAESKAEADLALARKTLHTLFYDVNIVSVAPIAVLDVARIAPASSQLGGTRLGPGGGVRLELASSVDFSLGYAVNVDHRAGEDHGALFFSMRFRDLFR